MPTEHAKVHGRKELGYQPELAPPTFHVTNPPQCTCALPIERFPFLPGCLRGTQENSVGTRHVLPVQSFPSCPTSADRP